MTADRKLPDTAALTAMCARIRRESDAMLVVAIRADDAAFSVDANLSPRDFGETLENEIPALVQQLSAMRTRRT